MCWKDGKKKDGIKNRKEWKREDGEVAFVEKIMTKNFPKLTKDTESQIKELHTCAYHSATTENQKQTNKNLKSNQKKMLASMEHETDTDSQ